MNNLKDTLKKYISITPQTFSYTMIGLSTAVLVFFIAYKDDDTPNSDDKPSKSDDELPEEDKEEYNFDKEEEEEPLRMGGSRASRASRALSKDKSKHGKNTNTRKKSNKKHK
jgi:hypothetical protein